MSKESPKDNGLEVEIYYDAYPKPKLVRLLKTETDISFKSSNTRKEPESTAATATATANTATANTATANTATANTATANTATANTATANTAININDDNHVNSPKNINNNINNININNNNINNTVYCSAFLTICCIGIGIMFIIIALKENKTDEKYSIKLEGEILYLFYLGVVILICIVMSLCGALLLHCCDICCALN
jgi:hypothetical protein